VAWAPDGRRAVYVRTTHHPYNADETRVEIADSSSGRIDAVLSKPGLGQAVAWAKNDFLYYSVHEPAPNEPDFNLWRVRLNSGTAHPIGSAMRVTSDPAWRGTQRDAGREATGFKKEATPGRSLSVGFIRRRKTVHYSQTADYGRERRLAILVDARQQGRHIRL
jgi:hypothetical protein